MADQVLNQCRLRIDHVPRRVKRGRSVTDRSRLWQVGVRDRVRDLCGARHNAGFVFALGSRFFNRDKLNSCTGFSGYGIYAFH